MFPTIPRHRLALALAACVLTLGGAGTHAAPAPQAPLAPEAQVLESLASVTISAKRGGAGAASTVLRQNSRILSRNFASSCAFMGDYNANDDDVVVAYANEFDLYGSATAGSFSDTSPAGDAASQSATTTVLGASGPYDDNGCSAADLRFAAGRNYIARKDKSLGLGFAAYDNKDYASARAQFEIAWNKIGYEEAALMLGKLHLYGLGTRADTAEGVAWLRKVVEARYDPFRDRLRFDPRAPGLMNARAEAAIILAKIYLLGVGTAKDPAQARQWFAKAAEVGYVPAENTLGVAYQSGYGGEKNARKARDILKRAADAGYAPAQYNLARLYYFGEDGVPRDAQLAGAWFEAAAKAGHPGALYFAGEMYDRGEGVAVNQDKAIVYYKEAALKGNATAQNALGSYFYRGQLVPRDLALARRWFEAAAKQGQSEAMVSVGVMASLGEGGPKDLSQAYSWLTLAKAAGAEAAGPALATVTPQLSAQERAAADAVLRLPAKP